MTGTVLRHAHTDPSWEDYLRDIHFVNLFYDIKKLDLYPYTNTYNRQQPLRLYT